MAMVTIKDEAPPLLPLRTSSSIVTTLLLSIHILIISGSALAEAADLPLVIKILALMAIE